MSGTHTISVHSNPTGQAQGHAPGTSARPTSLFPSLDQRRLRYPNRAGIARAQGCKDHHGLHPCAESGPEGRAEPDRRGLGGVLY